MQKAMNIHLIDYQLHISETNHTEVYFKGHVDQYKYPVLSDWLGSIEENVSNTKVHFTDFLADELKHISGMFSLIIRNGDRYYIATDIIRCYPVFYGFSSDQFFVTDDLNSYQDRNGLLKINNDNLEEYIASGFVYAHKTVFENVYATQAGEIVEVGENKISSKRYFKFMPSLIQISYNSDKEFSQSLDNVLTSVFRRMINTTPEVNRWVVPLSGGHDSRLIINYLFRLGIKNVFCYSYGMAGNEQSRLSEQVANALGYEWHFVEYTEQKWQKLHEQGIIDEFLLYSFNGVSIPHLQDFLAIHELKEKGVLKEFDFIIPGHTFDFLVGSNLELADLKCTCKEMAVKRTMLMHTRITDKRRTPVKEIEDIFTSSGVDPAHFQEYFNWQEKRAKFLVNACKGYQFLGFGFRLPFWDKEIVDFWLAISDQDRIGRRIFFETEKLGVLVYELIKIPFFGKDDRVNTNFLEKILRFILPGFVKTIILKITPHKAKYNAGLNQIYAYKKSTIKEMLKPIDSFPANVRCYFNDYLNRFPFQVDYHFMTSLYTIRKQLDKAQ